jgi:hypothetical protein
VCTRCVDSCNKSEIPESNSTRGILELRVQGVCAPWHGPIIILFFSKFILLGPGKIVRINFWKFYLLLEPVVAGPPYLWYLVFLGGKCTTDLSFWYDNLFFWGCTLVARANQPAAPTLVYLSVRCTLWWSVPTSTYTATFFTSLSEEALRGNIKTLEILTFGD